MNGRRVVISLLVGVSLLVLADPARAEQRSRVAAPAGLPAGEWQGIVDGIRQRPYRLEPAAGGGYEAANPAQGWTVAFNGGGADVRPMAADWTWGLRFVGYGYPGAERSVSVSPRLTVQDTRADYHWDEGLTEWLRNGPDGLKQTFVLAERPGLEGAAGPLGIALRVAGSLEPRLVEAGQGVSFADAGGVVRLSYRGLVVSDATGQRVPAWFEVTKGLVRLRVDDRNALYPLTVDPIAQQAYLKASNTDAGDLFGTVAISGDTVVVGAFVETSAATGVNGNQADNSAVNAGAAYVFVRSGGVWSQQAYLKASNTGAGDYFGGSVAIDGDTLVVGAGGEASAATGVNGNQADNTAAGSGAAYVFARSGTVWTQQAYLKASNTDIADEFGLSVAISGDTVVVGALHEASAATGVNGNQADNSASEAGAAYVFVRSGTVWTQQAYLKASNMATGENDFGFSVAISGDTVVVGAPGEESAATGVNGNQADNTAPGAGAAYVFVRSGGVWSQQAYLKASNTDAGDDFGIGVAIAGDTVVVGADQEASAATGVAGNQADNSAANAGAAYVFVRSGTVWSQQAYLKASNTGAGDYFGSPVISGDTVVVGATGEDSAATGVDGNQADDSAADAGAAYVFLRSGTVWTQQAYLKASNTNGGDGFGSVAISGDTVVVGAPREASAATGVDGNQADDTAARAGAAYVFTTVASASTTSTTSTTLPGCAALATYESIDCRLDGLVASLNAAQDLGKLKKRLVKGATKARTKKQKAEGLVATGKTKREKKTMKKAVNALSKFLKKVGSPSARKLIPPGTRQMLTDQTNAILADMRTLLGAL
jgi:FG-GAP repeat